MIILSKQHYYKTIYNSERSCNLTEGATAPSGQHEYLESCLFTLKDFFSAFSGNVCYSFTIFVLFLDVSYLLINFNCQVEGSTLCETLAHLCEEKGTGINRYVSTRSHYGRYWIIVSNSKIFPIYLNVVFAKHNPSILTIYLDLIFRHLRSLKCLSGHT